MDVVAVEPLEDRWSYPPFSGTVADGFVWGRGALDLKFSIAGLLEAVSQLLVQG
jgi:carboxypeptidase PM20D1